jgi:enolase-phosphatase E1
VKGHFYKDAYEAMKRWKTVLKIPLYVYSSGSVSAQKLLFGYSEFGNILELITNHYDTAIGMKDQSQSYHNIADDIFKRAGASFKSIPLTRTEPQSHPSPPLP